MGYLQVWGFDPDEAAKAQLRFRAMVEGGRALCGIDEARNAAIPTNYPRTDSCTRVPLSFVADCIFNACTILARRMDDLLACHLSRSTTSARSSTKVPCESQRSSKVVLPLFNVN